MIGAARNRSGHNDQETNFLINRLVFAYDLVFDSVERLC